MYNLDDSHACLSVSNSMLKEIEEKYQKLILNDEPQYVLKVTIKNFLENIRSALEYPTNYIFHNFCSMNYTEKELKRKSRNIYFPIKKDKKYFEKYINENFRGLSEAKPEIYQIFKNCQAFNNNAWSQHLADLSNKNKHINLTKHRRTESAHIKYLETINGAQILNCKFENCQQGIVINKTHIYDSNNPYTNIFIGDIDIEYLFEDLNKPILPILNEIYDGAVSVITEFEKVL